LASRYRSSPRPAGLRGQSPERIDDSHPAKDLAIIEIFGIEGVCATVDGCDHDQRVPERDDGVSRQKDRLSDERQIGRDHRPGSEVVDLRERTIGANRSAAERWRGGSLLSKA
jgi:hypothetical protein